MERDTLDYQETAIATVKRVLREYNYALIHMTMRARKTRTVLHIIQDMGLGDVLVVCPAAAKQVWQAEIAAVGLPLNRFVIVSKDFLSNKTTTRPFKFLIVDEVHNFRAFSKRTQSLHTIAKNCTYRIGMTGTPFDSSPLELMYPLKVLGRDCKGELIYKNKKKWLKDWGEPDNPYSDFPKYSLNPYKVKEFMDALGKVSFTHDPGNVDRPDIQILSYPLTDRQRYIIDCLGSGIAVTWEGRTVYPKEAIAHANNAKAQICSGFLYEEDAHGEQLTLITPSLKWVALRKIVDEIGGRAALWYNYTAEKQILLSMFPDAIAYSPGMAVSRECSILICHPRSAGAGIDLSHFPASIYCGVTNEFVMHRQSEFRISSQTKEKRTNYILCAKDSIEEQRVLSMQNKLKETLKFYDYYKFNGGDNNAKVHMAQP